MRRVGEKLLDHGLQGHGCFSRAGRPHEQEVIVGLFGLQEHGFDGFVRMVEVEGGCVVGLREPLAQEKFPAFLGRFQELEEPAVGLVEGGVQVAWFYGIKAFRREHVGVALFVGQRQAQLVRADFFHRAAEKLLLGHGVGFLVLFIEHHHVAGTEIGQEVCAVVGQFGDEPRHGSFLVGFRP